MCETLNTKFKLLQVSTVKRHFDFSEKINLIILVHVIFSMKIINYRRRSMRLPRISQERREKYGKLSKKAVDSINKLQ